MFRDERSAPVAASLAEIVACRSLLGALQTAMRAKQKRPPVVAQPAAQLLGKASADALCASALHSVVADTLRDHPPGPDT